MSRYLYAFTLLLTSLSLIGCSNGFEGTPAALNAELNSQDIPDASDELLVMASSSSSAQTDCSRQDATVSQEIRHADSDIRICTEYELDMPLGSSRYGETYSCDSDSKFNSPSSDWTYNSSTRKWTTPTISLRNDPYIVPGTYRLYAKDSSGNVASSNSVVVARGGYEDCSPSSTPPAPKIYVGTSAIGPWTLGGSVCRGSYLYTRLTGVSITNPPKGCATTDGDNGCYDIANHRNFLADEWVSSTMIQTGPLNTMDYPAGAYAVFISYGNQIIKVGTFTSLVCAAEN